MDLGQYIASLASSDVSTDHVGLNKSEELDYMFSHRYRFERIAAAIPCSPEALRVLDIGTTPFTFFIKQRHPNYDVWSLDRTALLKRRSAACGVELRVCDLDDEPPPFDDDFFDLIIFTEVLEHIFAPPSEVLVGIRRILRPQGKLIISVPNLAALKNRIKLPLGISVLPAADNQMKKGHVHGHGHLHEYTLKEIAALLENCGFAITRKGFLRPRVSDALSMPGHSWTQRLLRGAYHTAQALWPAFATQILIECYRESAATTSSPTT